MADSTDSFELVAWGATAAPASNLSDLHNHSLIHGCNGRVDPIDPELAYLDMQVDMTRLMVQKILNPTVMVFGVIGNVINIAVLTRPWMRSSTNFYLTALALTDVMYLLFAVTMGWIHHDSVKGQHWYILYRLPFGASLTDTFSNMAVWLTLTFTVERYIGVAYPMKGKVWCTPERARYIIIGVCASAFIITFPEFFSYQHAYILQQSACRNITVLKEIPSSFASGVSYQLGYHYLCQTLFTFLPLILLMVFNSLLIRAVMQATKQRQKMANAAVTRSERHERHQRDQQKITIMLISVVIVFLLCQLPQAIMNIIVPVFRMQMATFSEPKKVIAKLRITNNICNLLVMINSGVNLILYSFFSTKFRRTFNRLFCRCMRKNRVPPELFSDAGGHTVNSSREECRKHLLNAPKSRSPRPSPRGSPRASPRGSCQWPRGGGAGKLAGPGDGALQNKRNSESYDRLQPGVSRTAKNGFAIHNHTGSKDAISAV